VRITNLRPKNLIWLVVALAFLVRLWGITHGLPFIYHPDEPALVRSAYGLRFGNLNPGHFDWPHFHYYLCFFVFESFIKVRALLQVLNLRPLLEPLIPLFWKDPAIFYLLGRLVSALMGVGTVGLIYLVGKRLFNRRVGLLAALFLALSPLHVEEAHYALLDVPLTFWVTLSFYFSALILEKGRLRDYLLAGLFAGLAASTKYNGAFVAVAVAAAYLLRGWGAGETVRQKGSSLLRELWKVFLAGVVAIGGFLIGTPYALLDHETFFFKEDARGFLWQLESMKGHLGAEALNGWWFYLSKPLPNGLGIVLFALSILGVLLALVRRRQRDIFLVSFPILYFLYVGSWAVVYGRYLIPTLPFLCLLAAALVLFVVRKVPRPRLVLVCILMLTMAQPAWVVVKNDYLLTQTDTRTLAKVWIDENLPDKSRVAMDTIYGFFLDPFYLPNLRATKGKEDPEKGFYLYPWGKVSEVSPVENPEKFLADWSEREIDFLVTSSLVYGRYFKEETEAARPEITEVQAEYLWFADQFELLKEFTPQGGLGPVIKIYRVVYES